MNFTVTNYLTFPTKSLKKSIVNFISKQKDYDCKPS